MREIKFRAWDKTTRAMINEYAKVGPYGELYPAHFHSSAYSDKGCPDLVLMQFTGLLDRNGKEIFEGDIISNLDCFGCVSSWGDATDEHPTKRIVIYDENKSAFNWRYVGEEVKDRAPSGYTLCKENAGLFEIIGNIYSTPELLP